MSREVGQVGDGWLASDGAVGARRVGLCGVGFSEWWWRASAQSTARVRWNTYVLVDVLGWFGQSGTGRYVPLPDPRRVLDTREGTGDPIEAGTTRPAYPDGGFVGVDLGVGDPRVVVDHGVQEGDAQITSNQDNVPGHTV